MDAFQSNEAGHGLVRYQTCLGAEPLCVWMARETCGQIGKVMGAGYRMGGSEIGVLKVLKVLNIGSVSFVTIPPSC